MPSDGFSSLLALFLARILALTQRHQGRCMPARPQWGQNAGSCPPTRTASANALSPQLFFLPFFETQRRRPARRSLFDGRGPASRAFQKTLPHLSNAGRVLHGRARKPCRAQGRGAVRAVGHIFLFWQGKCEGGGDVPPKALRFFFPSNQGEE